MRPTERPQNRTQMRQSNGDLSEFTLFILFIFLFFKGTILNSLWQIYLMHRKQYVHLTYTLKI